MFTLGYACYLNTEAESKLQILKMLLHDVLALLADGKTITQAFVILGPLRAHQQAKVNKCRDSSETWAVFQHNLTQIGVHLVSAC